REAWPPYTLAAFGAVAFAWQWYDRKKFQQPLMYVIEHGDNDQSNFRTFLEHFKTLVQDAGPVTWPVFQKKKWQGEDGQIHYCLPLQAADFICYEQAKAATDLLMSGKREMRGSFRRIESTRSRGAWHLMESTQLRKFVRNMGIQGRLLSK